MLTSNLTTYNLPLQIPKLELELKKHTAMVKISRFETHSVFSVQLQLGDYMTIALATTISDVIFPTSLTRDVGQTQCMRMILL